MPEARVLSNPLYGEPPPRPTPHRPAEGAPPAGHRALRERSRETSAAIARARREPRPQTARELVQVFSAGTIPTAADTVYTTHPVAIDAEDLEGAVPSFTPDTDQVIPVVFLRNAPVSGDYAVAHAVAGRWVAEKGGPPKISCRWLCGPYVQFDVPAGCGGGGEPATATISVARDGTISGAALATPGTCYTVAHPGARVQQGPFGTRSGAVLLATVGEITALALADSGRGYNPASPPSVLIDPPGAGGTRATATATVGPDGSLSGLTIQNAGALYIVANPGVTIDPPPGAGARARAVATAKPGVVTSLKLTSPGRGYIDNSVPPYLNFTASCPTWSLSAVLTPGIRPGTAVGYTLALSPPGTLPYCTYSAVGKVDIPASGTCPPIPGVTMSAIVANTVLDGWCVMIDFTVRTGSTTYPCSGSGILSDLACLELAPAYPAIHPAPHSPSGRGISISCSSRPYSETISIRTGIDDRLYPEGEPEWYTLVGGTCPNQNTNATTSHQPNIFLNVTLSEP